MKGKIHPKYKMLYELNGRWIERKKRINRNEQKDTKHIKRKIQEKRTRRHKHICGNKERGTYVHRKKEEHI
jgi:hypothetical protein